MGVVLRREKVGRVDRNADVLARILLVLRSRVLPTVVFSPRQLSPGPGFAGPLPFATVHSIMLDGHKAVTNVTRDGISQMASHIRAKPKRSTGPIIDINLAHNITKAYQIQIS
jgi:hypothetical protein